MKSESSETSLPTDRTDNVMWRDWNRRHRKKGERKTVFRQTKVTNQFAYIFQVIGLVNVQRTLARIVLAARPVRLRKEGLGIRVIPNPDPVSKGLPHHLC